MPIKTSEDSNNQKYSRYRTLTRWNMVAVRSKSISPCQTCSDSFFSICKKQSNGQYGPGGNNLTFSTYCGCVKNYFTGPNAIGSCGANGCVTDAGC